MPSGTRRTKKATRRSVSPKRPTDLQIVIRYKSGGNALSEAELNKFIRKLKREHYYYEYLSGKLRYTVENLSKATDIVFTWKGHAAIDRDGIVYTRSIDLLTGDFNVLPEGVTATLISTAEV